MNEAIANAALVVSSALFASVWQGIAIVGVVWLALRLLPQVGAATRYAVWLGALLALVIIPVSTVSIGLNDATFPPAVVSSSANSPISTPVRSTRSISSVNATPSHLPLVVSIDSPGDARVAAAVRSTVAISPIAALAAALIWSLAACGRGIILARDFWKLTLIRRTARLWTDAHAYPVFLSDAIDVPLAAGFARPRIFVPASLVDRLDDDAMQAILIHEIAHLRRSDVWTNALARFAEILLATNPVAWFVMRRLAVEREIACDDWVVARTGAGDAFARTLVALASRPRARAPIAAASILGSRHAIVVRIERLLDARPRRLGLSPAALGCAIMVFALLALVLQSVSPVLAFTPPQFTQGATAASSTAACPVPNRGIVMTNFLPKERSTTETPAINVELKNNAALARKKVGAANVATVDITVNAAGKPSKVVASANLRYASLTDILRRLYRSSGYLPALVNCLPVESTVRLSVPIAPPEPSTYSAVVPVYAAGWSDAHGSCKIQPVGHRRYRIGYRGKLPYSDELPWYSGSMLAEPEGIEFVTVVSVHVHVDGSAERVNLAVSSGKPAFDQESLSAARRATYPLSQQTCPTMPTDYVWTTTFEKSTLIAQLGKLVPAKP